MRRRSFCVRTPTPVSVAAVGTDEQDRTDRTDRTDSAGRPSNPDRQKCRRRLDWSTGLDRRSQRKGEGRSLRKRQCQAQPEEVKG
eukprot:scaffold247_cov274-Pinguiococcus_pyrenoidosus.AAC.18